MIETGSFEYIYITDSVFTICMNMVYIFYDICYLPDLATGPTMLNILQPQSTTASYANGDYFKLSLTRCVDAEKATEIQKNGTLQNN